MFKVRNKNTRKTSMDINFVAFIGSEFNQNLPNKQVNAQIQQ